jgi:hypothetical protein
MAWLHKAWIWLSLAALAAVGIAIAVLRIVSRDDGSPLGRAQIAVGEAKDDRQGRLDAIKAEADGKCDEVAAAQAIPDKRQRLQALARLANRGRR